jgi:alanine racemase
MGAQISNTEPSRWDARLAKARPTWAEVNLMALLENYRALDSLLLHPAADTVHSGPRPKLIPVIKANAYGHGAISVAKALAFAGATAYAVALVEEGVALRQAGIKQEIIVLQGAWPGQEHELIHHNLISAVYSAEGLSRLQHSALRAQRVVSVHIKVDTGMARLGVRWDKMGAFVDAIASAKHITVAGIFSHLASADEDDTSFTEEQILRFEQSLALLSRSGIQPGEIHFANSAGLLYAGGLRQFSARPGIALYGYPPAPARCNVRLTPALTLKTRLGRIHEILAGDSIGYNRRFIASRDMRVATLPIGYADGYRRDLMDLAKVIINDRWARVLGAISMDSIVVDISELPEAREGDEVILLGSSARCCMDAKVWADLLGTIPYEILCGISSRVPRVYLQ